MPLYGGVSWSNNLTSLLWFLVDSTVLLYSFVYYSILVGLRQMLTGVLAIYVNPVNEIPAVNHSRLNRSVPETHVQIPKYFQKYVFYSWLKSNPAANLTLNTLFKDDVATPSTHINVLVQSVYRAVHPINLWISTSARADTNLVLKSTSSLDILTWGRNQSLFSNFALLLLDYKIRLRSKNPNALKDGGLLTSRYKWNFYAIDPESSTPSSPLLYYKDNFYLPTFNYSLLNYFAMNTMTPTLIEESVRESSNMIKTQLWLYKYSLLHRSTFKSYHNITTVKRLMGSGFYDSTLFTGNLWASNNFLTSSNNSQFTQQLRSLFNLQYSKSKSDLMGVNSLLLSNPVTSSQTGTRSISSYQPSFSWFLKRMYLFNGLRANNITSVSTISKGDGRDRTQSLIKVQLAQINLDLLTSLFFQSSHLTNNSCAGYFNHVGVNNCIEGSMGLTSSNDRINRDLHLHYISSSLFDSHSTTLVSLLLRNVTLVEKVASYSPILITTSPSPLSALDTNLLPISTSQQQFKTFNLLHSTSGLNEQLFLKDLVLLATKL